MASAASPSWVILGRVPRVTAADADLPPGTDLALALPAPPRVALLTIPPRVFPGRATASDKFPSVLAADASGHLLLKADQGPTVADLADRHTCGRPTVADYFVLDAKTASAVLLPKAKYIRRQGHRGLVACPRDAAHYMVAELQMIAGGDTADLLCFSSRTGEWVCKEDVPCPLPSRPLSPHAVLSHAGRLWWVDLSWCLLACDPFPDKPALRDVPLPEGKTLKPNEASGLLDKYRCVGVSGGKLRFVDMYRNRNSGGAAQISVWTLADPDSAKWTLEYEATFGEICDDVTYKATGLPRKIPVLALIHPTNPDVVYFFLDERMLGVDVRARKVVECEVYDLVQPPREHVSSRFVHAWQLPRALCSGISSKLLDLARNEFFGDEAPEPLLGELESWEESDEEREDEEDVYFNFLVDKFIAAAYPQGMNGLLATGPGQQEAATTPGASASGMEAWDPPQVAQSEGNEADVTSVAKKVVTRMLACERYTWKHQTTEDGPNGLIVLSDVKQQPTKDSCTPTAAAAVMESNLRVQLNKDVLLSVDHLIDLSEAGRAKFPNENGVDRLFLMIKDEGVLTEHDYKNLQAATSVRYRILQDHSYVFGDRKQMKHALYKLRNGGPLLGVVKISENYKECYMSGKVYKYDPNRVKKDKDGNLVTIRHAVCVISFAIEDGVPFLECQDSHGDEFSNKGFLKIDVTSLSQLRSIVVG